MDSPRPSHAPPRRLGEKPWLVAKSLIAESYPRRGDDVASDVTAQDAVFRNGDRSKILSHSVRLRELESSSPIFTHSLASNRLSPSSAFFCSSIFHSSKYFSRPSMLPLEYPVITLRFNYSSNSYWFLGFEARHPSEELPRFLLLGLEALLLLHACFPEFFLDFAATPLASYSRVAVSLKPRPYPSLQRRASVFLRAQRRCHGLACSMEPL